jgi:hypothetical protein
VDRIWKRPLSPKRRGFGWEHFDRIEATGEKTASRAQDADNCENLVQRRGLMPSIATQRAILTISFVESLCISLREWYRLRDRKSEQLFDLADRLQKESNTAIRLYPPITASEVRDLEVKIAYLYGWINANNGTEAVIGTSMILGMLVDLRAYCAPGSPRAKSIDRMFSLVKRIHRYFDRTEQKDEEYEKAWKALGVHERLLNAKVRRKPGRRNFLKQMWWLEFEDGEREEVMAA